MNPWIDAHCHLSDARYEGKLESVLAHSAAQGVGAYILGGVDPSEWVRQRDLIARAPVPVFSVFGLHPWFVDAHFSERAVLESALLKLPGFLSDTACVAVGELGLDHGPKRNPLGFATQLEFFERQIDLALSDAIKKPLVLHVVHAHGEALALLDRKGVAARGGLVHAFSASFEVASRYLDLGFSISIGGGLTRPGYETLKRAVKRIPADRLVIESDAPDFKPESYKSALDGLNDPGCLPAVASVLAALRGETAEQLLEKSRENLIRLFRLNALDTGHGLR